jgi:hypothetical protein
LRPKWFERHFLEQQKLQATLQVAILTKHLMLPQLHYASSSLAGSHMSLLHAWAQRNNPLCGSNFGGLQHRLFLLLLLLLLLLRMLNRMHPAELLFSYGKTSGRSPGHISTARRPREGLG